MKNLILLLLVMLSAISCKDEPAVDESLLKKHELLEANYKAEVRKKDSLKATLNSFIDAKKNKELLNNELFVKKEDLKEYLGNDQHFLANRKTFINSIFQDQHLNEWNFERALSNSLDFYIYDDFMKEPEFLEKYNFFNYIHNNVDRSQENLKLLISPVKDYVFSLFKNNSIYEDSGLKSIVNTLILIREDYALSDTDLEEIYNKCANEDYSDTVEFIKNRFSNDDISKSLKKDGKFSAYEDRYTDYDSRLFYVYSFWARRHHEGNADYVYELLKEFQGFMDGDDL